MPWNISYLCNFHFALQHLHIVSFPLCFKNICLSCYFHYTGWFKKMDSIEELTAPQHTPDSWLRFSARSTSWLAWATLKPLLNSSHVLLWYTWSVGAFVFTQTAYLLKLVIPTTNAFPRWSLNVETKSKRTLHSSRRLHFNDIDDMIFYSTAIGCIPGGSGTRLQTKITYNNNSQHQQYIEQTICPPLGGGKSADRTPSLRGIP